MRSISLRLRCSDQPHSSDNTQSDEANRLRDFVRRAEFMNGRIEGARIAQRADGAALAGLLSHESIGPRIYTMLRRIRERMQKLEQSDSSKQNAA